MPTPELVQQDGLTLDERFFARIAVKNGLLSETDLALATRDRVASGRPLADVLRSRGLLSDAQIARVREAQSASQVVRIDSLYADILVQRRLVPRSAIEEAFAEQRRRRYRVRVGELLVERGALSPEGHRAVLGALMRRASEEDVGSTAENRGLRAEEIPASGSRSASGPIPSTPGSLPRTIAKPPPPMPAPAPAAPPPPPPPTALAGWNDSPASSAALAGAKAAPPPSPRPAFPIGVTKASPRTAIPLDSNAGDSRESGETASIDAGPSFLESNVKLLATRESERGALVAASDERASDDRTDDFLASALQLRLASEEEATRLRDDERKRLADDVSKAESNATAALDRVVDRPSATDGEGARFSPDEWLEKKRRRRRLLAVFLGGWLVAALGLVAAAIAVAVTHRRAFDDAQGLVNRAESLAPAEQARLFAQARERHAAARGFGVSDQRWVSLDARILTSEARATAQAALDAGDPKTAQSVLQAALQKVAADDDDDRALLSALLLRADKEALIVAGKAAEEKQPPDWPRAVECFRNANAEANLQRVYKKMTDELRGLHDRALETRQRSDRDALAAALKVYLEITNDPLFQGLLREVDFSFAYWDAEAALANGRTNDAIAHCKRALGLKDDPETHKLLDRANKRLALDQLLERARTAARDSRLEDAARDFEEALPATTGDERRRVETELTDVKRRMGDLERYKDLQQKRQAAIELAKANDWEGVLATVPELERAGDKEAAKLRTFATRAKGMILVPRGPFEYGSEDNSHDSKKLIRPKKTVVLEAFLVDALEVSNQDYAAFIRKANRPAPSSWKENLVLANGQPARSATGEYVKTFRAGEERHPVTTVTWQEAADYAKGVGKRLLADTEWEKAARGPSGQKYPWGNQDRPPSDVRIQCDTFVRPAPCGDSRSDVSPFKVRDMAGNVAEWCADLHPTTDGKKHRIIRGGAFRKPVSDARCYAREEAEETRAWDDVGFRCALDLAEAPSWLVEAFR